MELNLSKLVEELPLVEKTHFEDELFDGLNDREWCMVHQINFSNPDIPKAKEILFREKYPDKIASYQQK